MAHSPFVRRSEPEPIADVNVVPLADVSLVLLIILLVLSPMAAQSMLRVSSAAAKAESDKGPKPGEDPLQPAPPLPVLAVGLSEAGYVVDGRLLGGDAELKARLAPELSRREDKNDKKVFLSPDLDVSNSRVVSAIEVLQSCGASAVALVQVMDTSPPPPAPAPRAPAVQGG